MARLERRGRNGFGPAILIAIGIIGLAANFDLVPREYLEQLWKLWPLIPLAIGIGILLARRRVSGDNGP